MPADPVVLAALVKALEAQPESMPIRLHLAQLLRESGGESAAMDHLLQVLNGTPPTSRRSWRRSWRLR